LITALFYHKKERFVQ